MRVNPDVRLVINGLQKPLITSRKSIPHLSNAELGLKPWPNSFHPYTSYLFSPNDLLKSNFGIAIFLKQNSD